MKILVICVGNELMLDDGLGIEVYRQVTGTYELPENVDIVSAGCMTLDMISSVEKYDMMISVDAIDGTGLPAGTILRYEPDDVSRRGAPMSSLHELKLADLFDAALLLGYSCEGLCLGMQVENASPSEFYRGFTAPVLQKLPDLVDTLLAELVYLGCEVRVRDTGELVSPRFHHTMLEDAE